jgi:hypothetical protein
MNGLVEGDTVMGRHISEKETLSKSQEAYTTGFFMDSYDQAGLDRYESIKNQIAGPNLTNVLPSVTLVDSKDWFVFTTPGGKQLATEVNRAEQQVEPGPQPKKAQLPEKPAPYEQHRGTEPRGPQNPAPRWEQSSPRPEGKPQSEQDGPPPEAAQERDNVPKRPPRNIHKPGTPEYYQQEVKIGTPEEKLAAAVELGDGTPVKIRVDEREINGRVEIEKGANEGEYNVYIYEIDANGKPHLAYRGIYDEETGKITRQKDDDGKDVPFMSDEFFKQYGYYFPVRDCER